MNQERLIARLFFGAGVRARVWKKLSTQLNNKMRLEESLRMLHGQSVERRSPLAELYKKMLTVTGDGLPLGAALEGLASQEETTLITSAQSAGRLSEGLELAAKVLTAKADIRKGVLSAIAYPCVLLGVVVVMMVVVSLHVMPQLTLIADPRTWTGAPYLLWLQSEFIASWKGVAFAIGSVCLLAAIFASFSFWTGRLRRIADRFVPWSLYRLTVGTVWLYTVATRMRAGHQLSQVLADMAEKASPYLREIVVAVLHHSRAGQDFGSALNKSGMNFPSADIVDDLCIYAKMPSFQENMMDIADLWLVEGVEDINKKAGKLKSVMFLLIISQLLLVALAVSGLQSQLGQSGGF